MNFVSTVSFYSFCSGKLVNRGFVVKIEFEFLFYEENWSRGSLFFLSLPTPCFILY